MFFLGARQHDWAALQALFAAYQAGDGAATRPLFAALSTALSRYFRLRVGVVQDSDDLTQACLLKLHFARDRYDASRSLKAWVYTIAGRCLIDHWRGNRQETPLDDVPESPDPGLSQEIKFQYNEELRIALETLKPIDRQIVFLYGVEELSMAEIGNIVGLSAGAVKVRAHRGYVKLRGVLAGAGEPK